MIIWGQSDLKAWQFYFLVACVKIGINALFNIIYVTNAQLFPALFSASAIGYCNFTARLMTMIAPMVAEIEDSTPFWVFTVFSGLSIIAILCVKPEDEQETENI